MDAIDELSARLNTLEKKAFDEAKAERRKESLAEFLLAAEKLINKPKE